jgi:hypothetical protein
MQKIRLGLLFCAMLWTALASPASSAEPEECRLTRFAEIPITTLPDGRFTIPVTLEGRTLNFLVDTGGAISTISSRQADNLQLHVAKVSGGLKGVAGAKLSTFSAVGTITVGGINWHGLSVCIDPDMRAGVDGTLAPDIIKQFDLDLDLAHGKLSLFTQRHCRGKVVYWTTSGYIVLPMELVTDGHIEVSVTLDGIKLKAPA